MFMRIQENYKNLKRILELSLSSAKAGFKLKNEGTFLGIFWYLLAPVLTFILLLLIFSDRLGGQIFHYPLYLLLGIIMFNYFQKITDEAVKVIRINSGIIKSINFPRESLIISVVLKTMFSHFFEIIILVLFLVFFDVPVIMILFYPLILIVFSIFALGISFIIASLEVYFFDLDNIWVFASKLIWFATPIFYAIEGQTRLFYLNLFNPLYYFITIAREIILYAKFPELWMMVMALFYALLFLLIGILIFNKLKPKFAELI